MNAHEQTPLIKRQPIEGRYPMTLQEWLETDPFQRSGALNPHIFMEINGDSYIVPVLLTDVDEPVKETFHG